MGTHKLIGLSFQVGEDALNVPLVTTLEHRYRALMEKWLMDVTGMTYAQITDDKTMDSYLGPEWSYVRMERFIGKEGVDSKGVQYHTSPRKLMDRIMYLGREIHSNFWINALFSVPQLEDWIISDVNYPNEGDAILERGGIVYRIDHKPHPMGKPDPMSRYPNYTERLFTNGSKEEMEKIIARVLS